jgi:exonuclease SbcC
LNILQTAVLNDEERIKNGKLVLENTIELFEKLKMEKDATELWLKSEKTKLPNLTVLSQVKIWHADHKNLSLQLAEIKKEIIRYQQETASISEALKEVYLHPIFGGLANDSNVSAGIHFLKTKIDQLKQKIIHFDGQLAHYRVQSKLEEYAVNLHDGEACPLCGSAHHPSVFNAASLTDIFSELTNLKLSAETEIALANEYINKISELENRLKFNTEQISGWLLKQQALDLKIVDHDAIFHWDDYKEEKLVNQAFMAAELLQKVLNEKEKEFEEVVVQLEKRNLDKVKYQAEIEKIRIDLAITQTEIKTLSEQIQRISYEDFRKKSVVEIESEKQAFLQRFVTIEKQYNDLIIRINEARKIKDTVGGSLEANINELSREQEINKAIQSQLITILHKSKFSSVENVKQILGQSIDIEFEKHQLADFKKQMMLSQIQFNQLLNEIDNRSYDAENHQKLIVEIESIRENLDQKNQELGKTNELQQKLQHDLKSQTLLLKELDTLKLRAEDLRTMKQLFKGSGFVNYVSSVHLQNLCLAANDRFYKLVRQKMSLEITEDNNFQVRDFLNGGKVRSVKTLSGGQTFQAALSLALALADSIQQFTESTQNFFFLDEGFGSLDKESLDVVFETLKSLRRESRIVGVISHVEEMQQEIDTHLRIINDENFGSRVFASWEQ